MVRLGFHRLNPRVIIPSFGTSLSACFDIRYCATQQSLKAYDNFNFVVNKQINEDRSFVLYPKERVLVPTGLILQIKHPYLDDSTYPGSYSIRLHARSSLALKHGIVLGNSQGIVDVDYQEEIFVILTNISNLPYTVSDQERIAQAEIVKNERFALEELIDRPEKLSERNGGFGSTGRI